MSQKQYEIEVTLKVKLRYWEVSRPEDVAQTALGNITMYPFCVAGEVEKISEPVEIKE